MLPTALLASVAFAQSHWDVDWQDAAPETERVIMLDGNDGYEPNIDDRIIQTFGSLCADLYEGPTERIRVTWQYRNGQPVVVGGDLTTDRAVCLARLVSQIPVRGFTEDGYPMWLEGTIALDEVVPQPFFQAFWLERRSYLYTLGTTRTQTGWRSLDEEWDSPRPELPAVEVPSAGRIHRRRYGEGLPREARRTVRAVYAEFHDAFAECVARPCAEFPQLDVARADAALTDALERHPGDVNVLRARARLASDPFSGPTVDEAPDRWRVVLEAVPGDPEALVGVAQGLILEFDREDRGGAPATALIEGLGPKPEPAIASTAVLEQRVAQLGEEAGFRAGWRTRSSAACST